MSVVDEPSSTHVRAAGNGRLALTDALGCLQRMPQATAASNAALEHVADAASTLFELEATPGDPLPRLRRTLASLSDALELLQSAQPPARELHDALEAVARAMAILYPIARGEHRRRRAVQLDLAPTSEAFASLPPIPERPRTESVAPTERRGNGRIELTVDLGLLSDSHFYAGLSRDLSRGGVFVATYRPETPGRELFLSFVLPDGHHVQTRGVVRWTSDAGDDTPPGMGIAFVDLTEADRAAVERYCALREPMYHLSADDDI